MSMLQRLPLITVLLALTAVLSGCSPSAELSRYDKDRTYKLTVLYTNDHSGQYWRNEKGEWGMAARKTIIDGVREEVENDGGYVLLLSGGNINKGVPESDLQNAVPDILGMNLLGYDAMVVGSNEFAVSPDVLKMQQALADFPMLATNVYESETGQPPFDAYTRFDFDGFTIGVLGLTTSDLWRTSHPVNTIGLDFIDPFEVGMRSVKVLSDKVDMSIVLAHLGHEEVEANTSRSSGDYALAKQVNGIDLIIGGHSQTVLKEPVSVNNTLIVQAGSRGQYVGRIDFEFHNGVLTKTHSELIPVNHHNGDHQYHEDPDMLALLSPYYKDGQLRLQQAIGEADERLKGDADEIRHGYTNLGTIIATSQQELAGADFAVVSAGSIKGSLSAGTISYNDILSVLPDEHMVCVVEMRGKEVEAYLRQVLSTSGGTSGFAQFSGITLSPGEDDDDLTIKVHNTRLRKRANYRMAISTSMARGADGYPPLDQHPGFTNLRRTEADALWSYIESHSPIVASQFAPSVLTE